MHTYLISFYQSSMCLSTYLSTYLSNYLHTRNFWPFSTRQVTFLNLVPGRLYNITLWTVSGGVASRPTIRWVSKLRSSLNSCILQFFKIMVYSKCKGELKYLLQYEAHTKKALSSSYHQVILIIIILLCFLLWKYSETDKSKELVLIWDSGGKLRKFHDFNFWKTAYYNFLKIL